MLSPYSIRCGQVAKVAALVFGLSTPALLNLTAAGSVARVDFNRDIRPLMADTCFHCHGPDANTRKGGLRLDLPEESRKAGKSGAAAIVPGNPGKSEIIARILTDDEDDVMPPKSAHKDFTAAQKELFRRWVAEGAEYASHWAFTVPKRPALPLDRDSTGDLHNPIDSFISQRLRESELSLSPEADRSTLIRRVSLDLTGIPPTLPEVEDFLSDKSPDAYESLVDRLLASPRYGERMAMQWLDYARYADSHGFQTDSSRSMWPWRDWVIRAFNENQPFDRFTIEQLAGDLLPSPTRDQLVATGFNRNHRINGEGGIIDEEWRIENIVDRVETTSATWLALTLNCARCHDHKYDPFSQKEFYQFFAYFNNVTETGVIRGASNRTGGNPDPILRVPTPEQESRLAALKASVLAAETRVASAVAQLPQLMADWEPEFLKSIDHAASAWNPLNPTGVKSEGGASFTRLEDGTYLAGGKNPPKDIYTITSPLSGGAFSGLMIEAFPDASLPAQSLGRNGNGNFVLSKVEAEIRSPGLSEPVVVTFTRAEADYSQKGYGIESLVPPDTSTSKAPKARVKAKAKADAAASNRGPGWAVDGPTRKEPRQAMLLLDEPITVPADATLIIRLKHEALNNHNIGRFRLSTTGHDPDQVVLPATGGVPGSIRTILATVSPKRSQAQRTELEKFYRATIAGPVKQADAALAAAHKQADDYEAALPTTMIMRELPEPREARLLIRGQYDQPGDAVFAALPAALPPLPKGSPNNRLGLAQWLVDPSNPLTARVWVNRQWERLFGVGLVKTSENFGVQSEVPSHPELLDWLATEFIRVGWDMKAMQKLIVMSATYRQSSRVTSELLELDPENRLLARGPRIRLPAELIRDQALAVSGLLVEHLGGPSVRPYMPEGVWDETSRYGDLRGYKAAQDDGLYRRTLYTIWKRTAAPPTMLLFDSPSREVCTVKRSTTNTPLQALALLNEVTYVEAARALGERMILEGGKTSLSRIAWAYELVTSHPIDQRDLLLLAAGLAKRLSAYEADPTAANALITQGVSRPSAKIKPAELAAYTLTANVLLNLDEVVTRP